MRLYGRETESRRIDSLLDAARAGKSGALVLRGEPGVGKTALLRCAEARAAGMTVLEARGLEVEAQLAFAGLSDLLGPVIDLIGTIPGPQAAALAGALAVGPAVAADRFVVGVATLSLLAAASDARPVLAVVDDGHWIDEASREALFFAARRLEAERVAVIVTGLDSEPALDSSGLDELSISGLDRAAAAQLLEAHLDRPIAPRILGRLMDFTAGNPLALREFASELTEAQLCGTESVRERFPPATTVERAFLRRVERLPADTRDGLVVAAADSGVTSTILNACARLGLSPRCLDPAEEVGVIRTDGRRTAFTHPLLRAAVYHAASSSARARAHRALAEAIAEQADLDGDRTPLGPSPAERTAWQMAAASLRPSEPAAEALEHAATLARNRGGNVAAASALERAAALSPSEQTRVRRLVGAARDWLLVGHVDSAVALLDQALILTTGDEQRAEIQQLRAQAKMWEGEWTYASELLATEARAIERSDPARATLMLVDAAVAASAVGELEMGYRLGCKARELGRRVGGIPEVAGDVIHGATLVFRGETERGAPMILRHTALAEGPDAPPVLLMLLPHVLICLEEYDQARQLLDQLVGIARGLGAPALLAPVLPLRAELAYRTGDWFAGYADAVEGVQLARETNQNVAASLVHLAQIEAARGLEPECRSHADEALELASQYGIQGLVFLTHALVGKLELGLGRVDEAVRQLELAAGIVERHGSRAPNLAQEAPDLIEAYCRGGRLAEAAKALKTLHTQADATRCSWALAAAARCRGLTATAETFEEEFNIALAWHKRTSTPFERARTELCFGERLRRAHRTTDARAHLRSALQTFERLDASSWAERARSELAATGETVRAASQAGLSELTPQELQLSMIVGRGATNKEAAAALFISPKTVEAHLHRTYVKLGIRSRTELARLLARARLLD